MTATSHGAQTYPFGPANRLELHPEYARLRREQPMARVVMPFGGEAWLVTRYGDAKVVLSDPRFSRAATIGRDIPRTTPFVRRDGSILSMDPPEHSRLRKLVAKAFTARRIEQLRPSAQATVDDLVTAMVDAGPPGDLAEAVAWPLPITVICTMLGVPAGDRDSFRAWTDQVLALTPSAGDAIEQARDNLDGYLSELIASRRVQPTNDLLGVLVAARDEGDRLSEQELVTFGVTLLIAGHETTANQIGNFTYTLLSRPELWQALVDDPELVPAAIEELMRFTPLGAAANFPRIATEDIELGGQTIQAGDAVVVQIASANRDAAEFEHPDEIDFDRVDNSHLGFGHGVHHCLGAQLARMELQIALGTLVRRLPGLRLAVPAEQVPWRAERLIRGVRSLPVTW